LQFVCANAGEKSTMNSEHYLQSLRVTAASALLALAALGCNSSSKAPSSPTAGTSKSTPHAELEPCVDYAQKICEKSGPESPTCASFKTATQLLSAETCRTGLRDLPHSFGQLAAVRRPCDNLVKNLCEAIGSNTKTCDFVKSQGKLFPVEHCEMMQQQLPQVISDLKKREAANQPLAAEVTTALAQGSVVGFGPSDAKVKVVEFADFECPFCSRAADVVQTIRTKYADRVQFVFRQFPLAMHPDAQLAAQAALAANAQGKFWEFHDRLFQNQRTLGRASLDEYAKQLQLDTAEFKRSLDEKKFAAQVESDMKLGERANVQGTPTLFINGKRVDNPSDAAEVEAAIEGALHSVTSG
jgi:protein-disulfide isomerase